MLFGKGEDGGVAGEGHARELAPDALAFLLRVDGAGRAGVGDDLLGPALRRDAVHLVGRPVGSGVGEHLGDARAAAHHFEALACVPGVEQVDGGGVAKLRLDGADVAPPVVVEEVDEELRGALDRIGGVARVVAPEQAEIRDGLELVEVGAGEHEEVAQHRVRTPVGGEIGEAVENVVRPESRLADRLVDAVDERLETRLGVEIEARAGKGAGQQRLVAAEAEVDQPATVARGGVGIGSDEGPVVLEPVEMPDDVVAGENAAERGVQRGKAGGVNRVVVFADAPAVHGFQFRGFCVHAVSPFSDSQ